MLRLFGGARGVSVKQRYCNFNVCREAGCKHLAELALMPGSEKIEVEGVRRWVRRVGYDGPAQGWDFRPSCGVVRASLGIAVVEESMAKAQRASVGPVVLPVCQLGGLPQFRLPDGCPYITEQTVS